MQGGPAGDTDCHACRSLVHDREIKQLRDENERVNEENKQLRKENEVLRKKLSSGLGILA